MGNSRREFGQQGLVVATDGDDRVEDRLDRCSQRVGCGRSEEGGHRHVLLGYPQTVSERTAQVRCARLCGVFAWEVSQDSNDHALVDEIATLL
jgi:hypothetical protein